MIVEQKNLKILRGRTFYFIFILGFMLLCFLGGMHKDASGAGLECAVFRGIDALVEDIGGSKITYVDPYLVGNPPTQIDMSYIGSDDPDNSWIDATCSPTVYAWDGSSWVYVLGMSYNKRIHKNFLRDLGGLIDLSIQNCGTSLPADCGFLETCEEKGPDAVAAQCPFGGTYFCEPPQSKPVVTCYPCDLTQDNDNDGLNHCADCDDNNAKLTNQCISEDKPDKQQGQPSKCP